MAKRRKKRLYKKNGRYYGDFRDFSEFGGGQEALIPDGERYATKKHVVAKKLGMARLRELRRLKKAGHSVVEVDGSSGSTSRVSIVMARGHRGCGEGRAGSISRRCRRSRDGRPRLRIGRRLPPST